MPHQEPLLQASPEAALLLQHVNQSSCLPSPTTAISVLPQLPLRGRASDAGPENAASPPFHTLVDHQPTTGRPTGQQAFGSSSWPSSSADSSLILPLCPDAEGMTDRDVAEWDTQDRLGCVAPSGWPVLSVSEAPLPGEGGHRASAEGPEGPIQCVLELELATSLE